MGCLALEVTSSRRRTDACIFYERSGYADLCDRSGRFWKHLGWAIQPCAHFSADRLRQDLITRVSLNCLKCASDQEVFLGGSESESVVGNKDLSARDQQTSVSRSSPSQSNAGSHLRRLESARSSDGITPS